MKDRFPYRNNGRFNHDRSIGSSEGTQPTPNNEPDCTHYDDFLIDERDISPGSLLEALGSLDEPERLWLTEPLEFVRSGEHDPLYKALFSGNERLVRAVCYGKSHRSYARTICAMMDIWFRLDLDASVENTIEAVKDGELMALQNFITTLRLCGASLDWSHIIAHLDSHNPRQRWQRTWVGTEVPYQYYDLERLLNHSEGLSRDLYRENLRNFAIAVFEDKGSNVPVAPIRYGIKLLPGIISKFN